MVLHITPMFDSFTNFSNPATNSTVRHIEFGMGVLALSIAALMGVRFATRQQGRNWAQRATPGGDTSTLVLDSYRPYVVVGAARKRYRIGGCGAAEGEFAQENPERGRASTSSNTRGMLPVRGHDDIVDAVRTSLRR